jgi:acetyl-CoA/propionyl-CoA carboxylase biotin carboxyl carrier protein
MDSGVYQGFTIPEYYDSLIAKVIAWGKDRETARLRMLRALAEYRIQGPATTIAFAEAVLRNPVVVEGCAATTFVENNLADLERGMRAQAPAPMAAQEPVARSPERAFEVEVNRKLFHVRVAELQPQRKERARKQAASRGCGATTGAALLSPMHGTVIAIKKRPGDSVEQGEALFIIEAMKMENEVPAQRSGTIASLDVAVGDTVETDQRMAVID